jgi:hypothetical protein
MPMKWTYDQVAEIALCYQTRNDFRVSANGPYKWAVRQGVLDSVCSHMTPRFRWSRELVEQEAAKFDKLDKFRLQATGAYWWAKRHECLDQVTAHMSKLTFWDYNSVKTEALRYRHRECFRQGAAGAAQWAQRNGVWNDVCRHMEDLGKGDFDVVYIWKAADYDTLYKVGCTSKRLGDKRIRYVANAFGLGIEKAHLAETDKAREIERELLSHGSPASMPSMAFGYSEFRELSPIEYLKCLNLMGIETASAA